jgi:hypothetical protein
MMFFIQVHLLVIAMLIFIITDGQLFKSKDIFIMLSLEAISNSTIDFFLHKSMELILALLLRSWCLGIRTRLVPTLVSKHIVVGSLMSLILRFHCFKLGFDHSAVISPVTPLFMELTIRIRIISRSLTLIGRVITATIASMIGLASVQKTDCLAQRTWLEI